MKIKYKNNLGPVPLTKKLIQGTFPVRAFTLVELIVVITILAILGTIGFISLQGFSRDARDSARISDLKSIEKGFEILLTTDQSLPQPEDYVEITASGTTISYQGYAGLKVMGTARVFGEGKDPLDDTYYTYVTDTNFRNYQLMGFLENGDQISLNKNILNKTQAIDYSTRYPIIKGKPLGIIVDSITKEPLQVTGTGIDLVTEISEYTVYLGKGEVITGTGGSLKSAQLNASCKRIKEINLNSENGIYIINPEGNNPFEVQCDMTTDGGGWTRISKSNSKILAEIPSVTRLYFEYTRLNSNVINRIALNEINITADGYTLGSVAELGKLISLNLTGGPLRSGGVKSGIWKSERLTGDDICIDDSKLNMLPNGISWGNCGGTTSEGCTITPGNIIFWNGNNLTLLETHGTGWCNGISGDPGRSNYMDIYVY